MNQEFTLKQASRITKLTEAELIKLDDSGIAKATKRSGKLLYNWHQLRRAHRVRLILDSGVGKYDAVTLKPKRRIVQDPCPVVFLVPKASKEARSKAEHFFTKGCLLEADVGTVRSAEEMYRDAISADPSWSRPLVHLGRLLCLRNHDKEAELMWMRALAIDPCQQSAAYNLSYLFYSRNEFETAVRYSLHAMKIDPKWADPHWMVAECWTRLGNTQNARAEWIRYIQLSDDDRLKKDAWVQVTKLG